MQGKRISSSIRDMEDNFFSEIDINLEGNFGSRRDSLSLENKFTHSERGLSFKYPSGWRDLEDDDRIMELFQNSQTENFDSEEYDIEEVNQMESLKNLSDDFTLQTNHKNDNIENFFIAMKSSLPTFSLGAMSANSVSLEEGAVEEIEAILNKNLKYDREDGNKTEVKTVEKGDDFVVVESVVFVNDQPTFKSKNLGILDDADGYIFNFNTTYHSWTDFENEFNLIISSIELNN